LVRLETAEELTTSLVELAGHFSVRFAALDGIGAVSSAVLGYYDVSAQTYGWREVRQQMEVVSLVGNISRRGGQPVIHAHAVLSGAQFTTLGGHVREAVVRPTLELVLRLADVQVERLPDPSGLALWSLPPLD
jgi:hypothetical protein